MDYSLLRSSVHGIVQARVLEWLPFPSPRDLPNPGTKPRSPTLQADPLPSKVFHQGSPYTNVRHLTDRSTTAAKSLQSCPTLCDLRDRSPPGFPVPGILQARVLEWLPFPPPGGLANSGIEPASPALAGRFFTNEPPGQPIL